MKKIVLALMTVSMFITPPLMAGELQVGMKAPDWSFKDAEGKSYTMRTWAKKVMLVTYVDPDESDLNEHFTDAMKRAKDNGRLTDTQYKGIGIADCAATWKPDIVIRAIAGRKAKKYKTTILFDYDASLRKAWGLKEDSSNCIIVDKNRICRAIVRGRVPDDQVEKLVQLCVDLQKE